MMITVHLTAPYNTMVSWMKKTFATEGHWLHPPKVFPQSLVGFWPKKRTMKWKLRIGVWHKGTKCPSHTCVWVGFKSVWELLFIIFLPRGPGATMMGAPLMLLLLASPYYLLICKNTALNMCITKSYMSCNRSGCVYLHNLWLVMI